MHYAFRQIQAYFFVTFFSAFSAKEASAELEIYFNKRQKQVWVHYSLCPLEPMNGDRKCVWAGMGKMNRLGDPVEPTLSWLPVLHMVDKCCTFELYPQTYKSFSLSALPNGADLSVL